MHIPKGSSPNHFFILIIFSSSLFVLHSLFSPFIFSSSFSLSGHLQRSTSFFFQICPSFFSSTKHFLLSISISEENHLEEYCFVLLVHFQFKCKLLYLFMALKKKVIDKKTYLIFSLNIFLCFSRQSIFSAVVFYMKHFGVKTRAVDSKKSRGGFFKRQLGKVNSPTS